MTEVATRSEIISGVITREDGLEFMTELRYNDWSRLGQRLLATRERLSWSIGDDDDTFAREALQHGVPRDLVDVVRGVVPNADELSGAALRSALGKAIAERPSLRAAEPRLGPEGLEGGARGTRNEPERSASDLMNRALRVAAGREAPQLGRHTNGLPVQE